MRLIISTLALAVFAFAGSAQAATAKKKSAAPVASKTAKAKKTSAKKAPVKSAKKKKNTPISSQTEQTAAGVRAADAALTPEELKFAQWVEQGTMPCQSGAVTVTADQAAPGYFAVAYAGKHYYMSPRVSATGAIRLEDQLGKTVWLQLANKSMLYAPKLGQRLADNCMSDGQRYVAEELLRNPPPDLLGDGNVNVAQTQAQAPAQGAPVLRVVEIPPAAVSALPSARAQEQNPNPNAAAEAQEARDLIAKMAADAARAAP